MIPLTTSDASDNCPECGTRWAVIEAVDTGDDQAHEGWEDWCYCAACKCELFYPFKLVKVDTPCN